MCKRGCPKGHEMTVAGLFLKKKSDRVTKKSVQPNLGLGGPHLLVAFIQMSCCNGLLKEVLQLLP